jgi:hypothetical protein
MLFFGCGRHLLNDDIVTGRWRARFCRFLGAQPGGSLLVGLVAYCLIIRLIRATLSIIISHLDPPSS